MLTSRVNAFLKKRLPPFLHKPLEGGVRLFLHPARTKLLLRRALAVRRRMDYPRRPIYLSLESAREYDLRRSPCGKEPETVAWIESSLKPGDVLYDIGANVGGYSLIAAVFGGESVRVFSFEPVAANYRQLCENVRINGLGDRVTPVPVALSDGTTLARFELAGLDTGEARHGGLTAGGPGKGSQPVLCMGLDDFIALYRLPPPHLIKLDVDGAEGKVLAGAVRTLRSPSLRGVLMEVDESTPDGKSLAGALSGGGIRQPQKIRHQGTTKNSHKNPPGS